MMAEAPNMAVPTGQQVLAEAPNMAAVTEQQMPAEAPAQDPVPGSSSMVSL